MSPKDKAYLEKTVHTIRLLFLLAVLPVGIVACSGSGSTQAQLKRAEALMESDPDAAGALLDSLQIVNRTPSFARLNTSKNEQGVKKLSNRKSLALYAVLRTQTDYKRALPFTSDSLIRIATDYYGTPHRKNYHAALAWYTLGCVCSERKDDLDAIDAYLRALELFPDTTIRYYSLAEQNLGIHYLNRQMLDDALSTFRSCRRHLKSERDIAYADYYIALTHLYNRDFAEAEQGFTKAWNNPSTSRFLKGESLLQLAKIALHHHADYPATLDYINRHMVFTEARYLGIDFSLKGDVFYAMATQAPTPQAALLDSAYHYYRQSLCYDNEVHTLCCNYRSLAELAPLTGQADSIGNYIAHYTLFLDSIGDLRRTEEIASLRNSHTLELEHRQMSYHQRWTWFFAAFIVFSVTLLLVLWFVLRDRKRKSDYISLCDEIRQSQLLKYESVQDTLDACCALFRKTAAYEIMSYAAQTQQVDKKAPALIAHDIDTCFAELRKTFKNEAPKVNDKEFTFIVCQYLDFDMRTISLFLSTAYSSLTSMKSRLKNKMPSELYSMLFPASRVAHTAL